MRKKRLAEILQIIREMEIENQNMLLEELEKRGYSVTQATVSRDINELHLEKFINDDGVSCYALSSNNGVVKLKGLFSHSVIYIDHAVNIVVVKCHPGLANAVCAAIDSMKIASIVGTIAGDDTMFIATRSEKDAENLTDKLLRMI